MFKNQKGESFAGILVWVFILSFVILWIVNIITFSLDSSNAYVAENRSHNITSNAYRIFDSLDSSSLVSWEEFYIYKDNSSGNFSFLTWATNESYRFIDDSMEYISDINTYEWTIYVLKWIIYKKDSFLWEVDTIVEINTSIY